MQVELAPQLVALIEEKVRSGKYIDASEVVSDSLRLLDERDRFERLKAAIAVGEAQYARGEVFRWTPETLNELKREADEEDRLGVPISDDVQP
jgi:antitoxin ParD1/3/4